MLTTNNHKQEIVAPITTTGCDAYFDQAMAFVGYWGGWMMA